jgi:hypothetical protein
MSSKTGVVVKDIDLGYGRLLRKIKRKKSLKLSAGVLDGTYPDGTSVVYVAKLHEFGIGVPKRSFIRDTVDEYRKDISDKLKRAGGRVVRGADEARQLASIAGFVTRMIKDRIRSGIAPANAPSTIAKKGSSTPLRDTDRLIESIKSKVTK